MSITDEEKMLVTQSFAKVAPIAEKAAELFYGRLFEIAPDTKSLFTETDMKEQGRKLMQTLATAVGALYQLDSIVVDIKQMGRRHIAYGVKKEQYATVGEALLWTLEQGLGDEFTPEVKTAWTKVYTILADTAITAYDEDKKAHDN